MPNPIKYTTGSESDALVKGNFRIGTGSVGKGPSDTTGYYQGPNVPSGGYVIYMNKDGAPGNLSYHSAANDAELISFTNSLAGQSYTGVQQCFDYYYGQTDKVLVNQDYPADYPYIVMDGLVLNLDAGITQSYPGSGTAWTDINGLGPKNNGTLINGPTFSGGSIVFDGVDDYVDYGTSLGNGWSEITVQAWVKPTTFPDTNFIFEHLVVADDNSSAGLESVFALIIDHLNNPSNLPSSFEGNLIHFGIRTSDQISRNRPIGIPDSSAYLDYLRGIAIAVNPVEYALDTWMFLTGTFNGSETKLYINGQFKATSNNQPDGVNRSLTGVLNTSSVERRIGDSAYGSSQFTGNIPTVQIYNRALSATEVLQNYNAQKGRFGL